MPESLAQVLSCEFCEFFKNIFFTEHLWATASEVSNEYNLKLISVLFFWIPQLTAVQEESKPLVNGTVKSDEKKEAKAEATPSSSSDSQDVKGELLEKVTYMLR